MVARSQADVMRFSVPGRREQDGAGAGRVSFAAQIDRGVASRSRGHTSSGRNGWKIQSTGVSFGS